MVIEYIGSFRCCEDTLVNLNTQRYLCHFISFGIIFSQFQGPGKILIFLGIETIFNQLLL